MSRQRVMYILCLSGRFFLTSFQLLFNFIGLRQSNSKKDWFLSEEEFKLWNRLYRLRDSDEIKEITLPQVQFMCFQNEDNRSVSETCFPMSFIEIMQ